MHFLLINVNAWLCLPPPPPSESSALSAAESDDDDQILAEVLGKTRRKKIPNPFRSRKPLTSRMSSKCLMLEIFEPIFCI
jgi:hypothetical protein